MLSLRSHKVFSCFLVSNQRVLWICSLRHGCDQQVELDRPNPHPGTGLATRPQWERHGGHRPDRFRENALGKLNQQLKNSMFSRLFQNKNLLITGKGWYTWIIIYSLEYADILNGLFVKRDRRDNTVVARLYLAFMFILVRHGDVISRHTFHS